MEWGSRAEDQGQMGAVFILASAPVWETEVSGLNRMTFQVSMASYQNIAKR